MSTATPPESIVESTRESGWFSGFARMLLNQLFAVLTIVWLNGVTLRMSVRDSADLLAPLYYATPWPVLAVLTLVLLRYVWRMPMAVFAIIFIAHMVGGAWIMESWRHAPLSEEPADLRVLQWNVGRTEWSRESIIAQVKTYDADVIAISEPVPTARDGGVSPRTGLARERWQAAFPDYRCQFAGNELLTMIRGETTDVRLGTLHSGSPYALYEARIRGHDIGVVQVDIDARPVHPRKPPLTALAKLVETLKDRPLIVIGDFNTPRDSVHLDPLRKELKYAWEASGRGCAETWPSFLPVLSLDQVWSGPGLRPIRCQHGVTFRSNHRPVFAEYRFD